MISIAGADRRIRAPTPRTAVAQLRGKEYHGMSTAPVDAKSGPGAAPTGWESKRASDWTCEEVAEFVRGRGRATKWTQYAARCVSLEVDGATLVAANAQLLQEAGFSPLHSNALLVALRDFEDARASGPTSGGAGSSDPFGASGAGGGSSDPFGGGGGGSTDIFGSTGGGGGSSDLLAVAVRGKRF